jgi:alkanesulfonate monooxygenase SsuD/methylene tetrahydromethanopterin reductase-like flavin-dependent oxidoreductase (luciferase family)
MLGMAQAVDRLGYDSLWLDDHIINETNDPTIPKYEGWVALTAFAASTSNVRVGHLVNANPMRNPAMLAKQAVTLDHVSNGRYTLGLGAAWFQEEHEAFGIDFPEDDVERLAWLDEAAGLIKRLVAGETVTHDGPRYRTKELKFYPEPVQQPIPLLIGAHGTQIGPKIVAKHADAWNTFVRTPAILQEKRDILRQRCEEIGRDPSEIELTLTRQRGVLIRDDEAEARQILARTLEGAGYDDFDEESITPWCGKPERIAESMRAYVELGFRHIIVEFVPPYDMESAERLITEVKPLLAS